MNPDAAISLAADLLRAASALQTPHERRQQAELGRMIDNADDKATLVEMTDQAFRTHTPARVADQLTHLLDVQGIPRFFSPVEQAMLRGFQSFGEYLPGVAVPLVKQKMRQETANVILPAEPELLAEHLRNRQSQGVQMNVNLLGEAILGEAEAKRRIAQCCDALRMPEIHCLSVKISTVYSQVSPLARQHTIAIVADRLETLYRTAARELDPQTGSGKFVYLDMEEYRDLFLTADILCTVLDPPDLQSVRAGVALQAYIPDSYRVMQRLIEWSRERVAGGGTPLTIRLVKGANMEMERVEASIAGYEQAPYTTKVETDANYKRMLRELIDAAKQHHVRLGVASHNLFDVALALLWARDAGLEKQIQFEMLEGMANHQRRAISEQHVDMLLYAPACHRDSFLNAIGYLIRRLDENTGPQNFLRHAYRLKPDTPEFDELASGFRQSLAIIDTVSDAPRRTQDRNQPPGQPSAAEHWSELVNEPDTDFALPHNADWAQRLLDQTLQRLPLDTVEQTAAANTTTEHTLRQTSDPSRPGEVVYRYPAATLETVRAAVDIAKQDKSRWRERSPAERHRLLRAVAQQIRQRRGDLVGAMVAEGGKTIAEADPEVSEAIDFCEFYPLTVSDWSTRPSIRVGPRGVVAVVTPWNFPLAIPCGGIAAALAAGNNVLLKPASQTVLIAQQLCECFWDAGIPADSLQLVPCDGSIAESGLVKNPDVSTVILTGGTATARRMLAARPDVHLLAETGGKNATIVTAMADRDQAVKHVIHSAFSHAGQKCSATSLLLLEDEVFHDQSFRDTLADAVSSLHVGSAWELHTKIGPLIRPPQDDLARGLKTLEDDESWLVAPENIVGNPNLYRPGVKWNIRPGGFMHLTELFGPVLGVMRYSRLEEAIEIIRSTGYGLTSGLESLDDREIQLWRESIHAGNLYINRPTTGAIVLRQPFGGVGLSAYGPGVKAGGPHYVLPLMHVTNQSVTTRALRPLAPEGLRHSAKLFDTDRTDALLGWLHWALSENHIDNEQHSMLQSAIESQQAAFAEEFSQTHDSVQLIGQDNFRRYRPVKGITIRIQPKDDLIEAIIAITAAIATGSQITVSIAPGYANPFRTLIETIADWLPGNIHPLEETDDELIERIRAGHILRLRAFTTLPTPIEIACGEHFITTVTEPVISDGRIESLRYVDEQSISHTYHRYGNIGRRA